MSNCYRVAAAFFALIAEVWLARPAAATVTVDCTVVNGVNNVSGYLQTVLNSNGGQTYDIKGTCLGPIAVPANATLDADPTGGTIKGHVTFGGAGTVLRGLVIDGTGLNQAEGVIVYTTGAFVTINNCTIENWVTSGSGDGAVLVFRGGSANIVGGFIENNSGNGLIVADGGTVELGYDNNSGLSAAVVIQNNGSGGIYVNNASLDIQNATVQSNQGNGLGASLGQIAFNAGTIASASGSGVPAVQLYHSGLVASGTITGPGDASAILASSNSSVILEGATITDSDANGNDAVLYLEDGSSAHSFGGNTITNSAPNGNAIVATNGSTFHQRFEAGSGNTNAADTITGGGTAQVESNIEVGTGAANPSTWNGSIDAAQNSSIRMDGGITVNGSVTFAQASNGFFNLTNTGTNVVTGGVLCPFATNQSAHVTASAKTAQLANGSAAVTFGSAANDCLNF
jgi:hypothetical protein